MSPRYCLQVSRTSNLYPSRYMYMSWCKWALAHAGTTALRHVLMQKTITSNLAHDKKNFTFMWLLY